MKRNTIIELISVLFILLFVYTAIYKLVYYPTLKYVLGKYPILGWFPGTAAVLLPVFELFLVGLLIMRRTMGLRATLATFCGFTVYIAYMLVFLPGLPCTCGGLIQQLNWPSHLALNTGLTGLAYVALRLTKQELLVPSESARNGVSLTD